MTFFSFWFHLTDMKFLVAVCFLAICAVTVQSRFADQRQEYERDSVQKNHGQGLRRGFLKQFFNDPRDPGGYSPPTADRTTQIPNCKPKGGSCSDRDDCCYCETTGGYYSCMICSSMDNKCF